MNSKRRKNKKENKMTIETLSIEFFSMSNICETFGIMESITSWNGHKIIEWKWITREV